MQARLLERLPTNADPKLQSHGTKKTLRPRATMSDEEIDPTVWHVRELEHGWWHKLEPYSKRWFFVVRERIRAMMRACARQCALTLTQCCRRAQHEDPTFSRKFPRAP